MRYYALRVYISISKLVELFVQQNAVISVGVVCELICVIHTTFLYKKKKIWYFSLGMIIFCLF